ncbi:MAG: hypothetical protein IGBAC_0644 [Ignavibacteriae bacterium]|nr:MAG: hypothetical protein IGBAC_0644 [Ignavibacteriota bacterium]
MKYKNIKYSKFNQRSLAKIGKVLNAKPKKIGNYFRYEIVNKLDKRKLALEIYPQIKIGNKKGNMVTVYALNSLMQLHFCSGFIISEELCEVTFIGEINGKLSGLIVEKEAGCSLFANVDKYILSGDFTKLNPEVMISSIALSLAESLIQSKNK